MGEISTLFLCVPLICSSFSVGGIEREKGWLGINTYRKNQSVVMSGQLILCWVGRSPGCWDVKRGGKTGKPYRRRPAWSLGFTWGVLNTVMGFWKMSDFSYTKTYNLWMWIGLGLSGSIKKIQLCNKNTVYHCIWL